MSSDELSPDEEAELERLAQEVVDEAARVGVDWEAARERMRALAEATWTESEDSAPAELTVGLDMTLLLDTLRRLPDDAGTARFLAAYQPPRPFLPLAERRNPLA